MLTTRVAARVCEGLGVDPQVGSDVHDHPRVVRLERVQRAEVARPAEPGDRSDTRTPRTVKTDRTGGVRIDRLVTGGLGGRPPTM
ncbi:hypothetical protein GCM10009546_28010 [Actinomadura livida]|uniref:Uncharacterized protein n=1 Tax=Actinomadura livida TaxID=79909 RepID=A0ABN1ED39_9ACTN|nr:hypothetical protein GCM10010208_35850 [Actinomadura livida]